eukprot:evm.model.scf_1379.2 EVM.evm.TU.scf_1379.2   scf_1379:10504-11874(+)
MSPSSPEGCHQSGTFDAQIDMLDNGVAESAGPGVEAPTEQNGPRPDSPRTLWFRANRAKLEEKEEEEKKAKAAILAKAKAYVKQFTEQRQKGIEERMSANRAEEQNTKEVTKDLQGGTPWEGVVSRINFNLGAQQKDTSRLRAMLFQARENNLPIKGA